MIGLPTMLHSSRGDGEGWRHPSGYVTVANHFRLGQAQLRHQFDQLAMRRERVPERFLRFSYHRQLE